MRDKDLESRLQTRLKEEIRQGDLFYAHTTKHYHPTTHYLGVFKEWSKKGDLLVCNYVARIYPVENSTPHIEPKKKTTLKLVNVHALAIGEDEVKKVLNELDLSNYIYALVAFGWEWNT